MLTVSARLRNIPALVNVSRQDHDTTKETSMRKPGSRSFTPYEMVLRSHSSNSSNSNPQDNWDSLIQVSSKHGKCHEGTWFKITYAVEVAR